MRALRLFSAGVMLSIGWQVGQPVGHALVDALARVERAIYAALRGPVKAPVGVGG